MTFTIVSLCMNSAFAKPRRHSVSATATSEALDPSLNRPDLFESTGTPLCDHFYSILSKTSQTTMDSFLGELMRNEEFSETPGAKAAMYHSRAKHGSSMQDPRALIMFGMGDLVLAFNGDKSQNFYDVLEVMCYNRKVGQFEFRAIQFPADSQPTSPVLSEVETSRENYFRATKANPTSCQECHGSHYVRPVWGTYLNWPGSFGSYEEAFAIPRSRFAVEDKQLEFNSALQFQTRARAGQPRYGHFIWADLSHPYLNDTINNSMFGILINYKMSNPAIRQALQFLSKPEKQRFKYAFVGYLLSCEQDNFIPEDTPYNEGRSDSPSDLRSVATRFVSERAAFELRQRETIAQDLQGLGELLTWKGGVPGYLRVDENIVDLSNIDKNLASIVLRSANTIPNRLRPLVQMENLYAAMGLSSEALHLQDGKTSWDGYNEIQNYMADYILRYYALPEITPIQKREAETQGPRDDLDTKLSIEDYQSVLPFLEALQLPKMEGRSRAQFCSDLAKASQNALSQNP